jgi:hypothetical protein
MIWKYQKINLNKKIFFFQKHLKKKQTALPAFVPFSSVFDIVVAVVVVVWKKLFYKKNF